MQLPPSLVGFLPLLFAEDAEHVEDRKERREADPARVESILLQLLASCSRTTSGGESFARCHELFGSGDVVVLTPSPELTSPTRIRVLRDDLVMLTSTNTYRVQHADERKIVRGTGYSTWCLLVNVSRRGPGPERRGRVRAPHVHLVLPPGRGERDPDAGGGLAFVAVAGRPWPLLPRGGGAPVIFKAAR